MNRVLIVEDSPTQAQQLQLILDAEGFAVDIARDGREALGFVNRTAYAVVITDILMPGISGFELCSRLKGNPESSHIPVIILTTLSDPMDMIRALECGADNYITKPYQPEYLLNRLNSILHSAHSHHTDGKFELGTEIQFLGRKFSINSDKKQILNLLISTFEDIVRTNNELKASQSELTKAMTKIEHYAEQLEGRVRLTEEKYSTLMTHANDAIVICNANGEIVEVNRQAESLLDHMEPQLVGRKVEKFLEPDDIRNVNAVQQMLENRDEPGRPRDQVAEFKVRHQDNEIRYIEASAGKVELDDENLCIAILRDVTKRKEVDLRLRESEERYRTLVEGSVQGLMIIQGDEIVFCNAALASLFGYARPEELIGFDPLKLVDPADRELFGVYKQSRLGGLAVDPVLRSRGVRQDGQSIWFEAVTQLVVWQSHPAIQTTCVDITNEKRLQEELLVSQRMEAVGRLAGAIAHDFNNMLAVTSSYSELVIDQLPPENPAREDVKVILDASEKAAALTRQLLAFSRRQVLRMETLNINEVVTNTEKMLRRLIGEDINLRIVTDPALQHILADKTQIEQIIMNLAINSRDAMPKGGNLTIRTGNKLLDEHYTKSHFDAKPGSYVMLAISDTGIGMTPETKQRIFEPFFTTKEPTKGTGLGLSTVYGIVKQMEGSIWVYSEINNGTTIKIYLPATQLIKSTAQPSQATSRQVGGSETVLLVEDDDAVREGARRILALGGYSVLEATNGQSAIDIFKANVQTIQLVLSDVVMPGITGKEMIDQLRGLRAVPVLFMSGYTDDSVISHGILEGEFPFINKPFTKDSLLTKVREVLDCSGTPQTDAVKANA